jgi:hypothetical protein
LPFEKIPQDVLELVKLPLKFVELSVETILEIAQKLANYVGGKFMQVWPTVKHIILRYGNVILAFIRVHPIIAAGIGISLLLVLAAVLYFIFKKTSERAQEVADEITKMEGVGAFMCPIAHTIMKDPVQTPDGDTYERSAIESYILTYHNDFITGKPLTVKQLTPNLALKSAIEQFLPYLTPKH